MLLHDFESFAYGNGAVCSLDKRFMAAGRRQDAFGYWYLHSQMDYVVGCRKGLGTISAVSDGHDGRHRGRADARASAGDG